MIIENPTNKLIEVEIKGVKYSLEAAGVLTNIDPEVAEYWQGSLHNFLIVKDDAPVVPVKKEVKIETKPEVKTEVEDLDSVISVLVEDAPVVPVAKDSKK